MIEPLQTSESLKNLIDSLELMGNYGDLKGKDIFLLTDNTTTEHIARKGSLLCCLNL